MKGFFASIFLLVLMLGSTAVQMITLGYSDCSERTMETRLSAKHSKSFHHFIILHARHSSNRRSRSIQRTTISSYITDLSGVYTFQGFIPDSGQEIVHGSTSFYDRIPECNQGKPPRQI